MGPWGVLANISATILWLYGMLRKKRICPIAKPFIYFLFTSARRRQPLPEVISQVGADLFDVSHFQKRLLLI